MLLPWFKKLIVLTVTIFLFSISVLGQDDSAEAEGEVKESGEAAVKSEPKKTPSEDDWAKQATVLNTHEGRIKVYKTQIEELIVEKQKTKDRAEKQTIISKMIQAHMTLQKETKSYNEIYNKIRYRFPDKGNSSNRRYMPMRVDSLEAMEEGHGLDAMLSRSRALINQKYKPFMKEKVKATEKDVANKKKKGFDMDKKEKLKLER